MALLWGAQAVRPSVAPGIGTKIIFVALALASLGGLWWCALRPVLIADATGIVVRNLFSTEMLGWGEVVGFRIGRYKLLGAVCLIDLRNGSSVHAYAIQIPNISRGRQFTRESEMIDDLNTRLANATGPSKPRPTTQSEQTI